MGDQLPTRDHAISKILDEKGFIHVISACQAWLENKAEHQRAYSDATSDEKLEMRLAGVSLQQAIQHYSKS